MGLGQQFRCQQYQLLYGPLHPCKHCLHLMKLLLLIIVLISPYAEAGVFSTEKIQAYPADWPVLVKMSDNCHEVEGLFVDTDRWRWEREEMPGSSLGAKYGGTREAAWVAFGFLPSEIRAGDSMVRLRSIKLMFDAEDNLVVSYLIDEKVAASKLFTKGDISCNSEGLQITTSDRTGTVLDKFPNEGRLVANSTFYRSGEFLYVKQVIDTKARIYGVVPQSFHNVTWFRFPVRQP